MKTKIGWALFVVFCIGWGIFCGNMMISDEQNRIRSEGKAARENGFQITVNPYTYDKHRELWREGWRSGNLVNE